MIRCVIVAFEEAGLVGGAVTSSLEAGCSSVHVFDGAFDGYADHPLSSDETLHEACSAGAYVWGSGGFFPDRASKITFAFHHCGAKVGDHVLLVDADERLRGRLEKVTTTQSFMLIRRDLGDNDMPGIRLDWPRGDYSREGTPMLRLIHWTPNLCCVGSGKYARGSRPITAYRARSGDQDPATLFKIRTDVHLDHMPHDHLEDEHRARRERFYTAELARG